MNSRNLIRVAGALVGLFGVWMVVMAMWIGASIIRDGKDYSALLFAIAVSLIGVAALVIARHTFWRPSAEGVSFLVGITLFVLWSWMTNVVSGASIDRAAESFTTAKGALTTFGWLVLTGGMVWLHEVVTRFLVRRAGLDAAKPRVGSPSRSTSH